jgi:hypothetical protein
MLEKLYMSEVRTVVLACLDSHSPTTQGEALAMRGRWLAQIAKGLLVPEPGVREALEELPTPI